ncbi:MAG: hypothetical protein WAN86_18095, partial [Hyphomicrobiaceae bacterium]
ALRKGRHALQPARNERTEPQLLLPAPGDTHAGMMRKSHGVTSLQVEMTVARREGRALPAETNLEALGLNIGLWRESNSRKSDVIAVLAQH